MIRPKTKEDMESNDYNCKASRLNAMSCYHFSTLRLFFSSLIITTHDPLGILKLDHSMAIITDVEAQSCLVACCFSTEQVIPCTNLFNGEGFIKIGSLWK